MAKNRKQTKTNKAPMKFLVAITALLVVVMGALLFVVNSDGGSNSANVHEGAPPVDEQPTYGDESATVSVIEFGDYKCPACGTWTVKSSRSFKQTISTLVTFLILM
nr:thioredoxin domain-containing protein [Geomicrobium sp. JCM 19038]